MKLLRLFCLPLLCLGLTPTTFSAESKTPTSPSASSPSKPPTVNLDFPGGTLTDLLTLIARNDAVSFNLIGEKELMSTVLPAFSLRNAQLTAVYDVLRRLLETRRLSLDIAGISPESLVCVLTQPEPKAKPQIVQPPLFESFQLGPYLEKQSIDDIVTAIRLAWELNPANKPDALQLKFHPPTTLLLVSGPPEAIKVADKVIWTLSGMVASNVVSTLSGASDGSVADKKRQEAVAAEVVKRRQAREKSEKTPQEQETKPPARR